MWTCVCAWTHVCVASGVCGVSEEGEDAVCAGHGGEDGVRETPCSLPAHVHAPERPTAQGADERRRRERKTALVMDNVLLALRTRCSLFTTTVFCLV